MEGKMKCEHVVVLDQVNPVGEIRKDGVESTSEPYTVVVNKKKRLLITTTIANLPNYISVSTKKV